MFEMLGFLYGLAKELAKFSEFKEETKFVDHDWLAKSGFKDLLKGEDYELRWSQTRKAPSREFDGWEVVYEIDKTNRVRNRIELTGSSGNDSLVLIARHREHDT